MKRPTETTNLRRFKKRKLREDQKRAAESRRAHEGETKHARAARAKQAGIRERILDGARRSPTEPDAD